jgi:Flp pilus assembly protein TadD|tara:strand:- start:570 stop:1316 length:747 start_codon:yes stop_codon:yes gene_type:complete
MTKNIRLYFCFVGLVVPLFGCETIEEDSGEEAITAAIGEVAVSSQDSMDYEGAADRYHRLYEREPDNIDALIGFARNLRYAGRPRLAIRALREGLDLHGELTVLLVEMAKDQLAASLIADADESLARARATAPNNWEVHALNGILRDRVGDFETAHTEYRLALKLSPGNISVLNNMALSLAQAGRIDSAIEMLEPVARGENSTVQTRQNLALLYALSGDVASAAPLVGGDLPADVAQENLAAYRRLHE